MKETEMQSRARKWLPTSFDYRWKLASDHSLSREDRQVYELADFAREELLSAVREIREFTRGGQCTCAKTSCDQ